MNRVFSIVLVAAMVGGCSRLAVFDAVVPKDWNAKRIVSGINFGPDARQKLDIYLPDNRKPTKVVIFVYGGSWNSGSRNEYAFVGRALASRGFATVIADYRLAPGHRYPDFVTDTAKAAAWTHSHIREFGGDPNQLYLVGHSAGAYNVMMVALDPAFLRREGEDEGIVKGAVGLSGPYDFLPLAVDATRAAFANTTGLEETQPVYWATKGRKPPIFVATGDADELVQPRNTRALAAALRSSGNSVKEENYPGIDHTGTLLAISKPLRHWAPVLDDIVSFINAH